MKNLLLIGFLILQFVAIAQRDYLWKPDSVWSTRFPDVSKLKDSTNFFIIKGDSIEFRLNDQKMDVYEKGKIIRWTDTLVNNFHQIHFYITKRKKILRGSLTVDIKQVGEKKYVVRVRNGYESFDKTIHLTDIGSFPIIRPKKKVFNPAKK
ncbi:MAG: hypothetical protein V4638_00895 [Bacteroidota bacterium]